MAKKSILIIIALAIVGIGAGLFVFRPGQEKPWIIQPPPFPPELQIGEEAILRIFAGYEDGTGVENVKITLLDTETDSSWTLHTGPEGEARFSVIVGKTYAITATSGESSRTVRCTIGSRTMVGIYLSQDGTIESIWALEGGQL